VSVPERVRNVHRKKAAEALTFPFVRIIASRDPVYSFLSGYVREVADDIGSHDSGLANRFPELLLLGPLHNIPSGKHRLMTEDLKLGRDSNETSPL
jgi:hypothetical protein